MEKAFQDIISHFEKQLAAIHAGRVSPSVLDHVVVEAYGTMTPLNQLASITNLDAQTLSIQPWDAQVIKDIERAMRTAEGDFNPAVDGTMIRLHFPPMTEEKRKTVVKSVHEIAEDAHVAVKKVREDMMNDIKNQKNNGDLSEDGFFAEQKSIQAEVDEVNGKIKEIASNKEAEVMKV